MGALKGIWIFRMVFYGTALALIAVHFWPHADRAVAQAPPLQGWTSQGRAIELRVGRPGATALDTTFRVRCGDGRIWFPRWWPSEGAPVHFQNRGQDFFVREKSPQVDAWMKGRISSDRSSAGGVARLTTDFDGRVCDSGLVRWSARS